MSERRPRVAYQGERGAYGEEAVRASFGDAAVPLAAHTFAAVAEAVRGGAATHGVLPVENSIVGIIDAASRLLDDVRLLEIGRVSIPVRHCLLGLPGSSVQQLRRVDSHPVALAQCSRYLASIPHAAAHAAHDTAGAAREVSLAGDVTRAAIASATAARMHRLEILATGIADSPENLTTFAVITLSNRSG